jgi:RNase adaptor protein for sRNA GlmZ degradation
VTMEQKKNTPTDSDDEVSLSFLPSPRLEEGLQKVGLREDLMEFVTKVGDLKKWFKGYKVESIELNIEGAIKDGNIIKLFVSFEGKGGCKIILKPEQTSP